MAGAPRDQKSENGLTTRQRFVQMAATTVSTQRASGSASAASDPVSSSRKKVEGPVSIWKYDYGRDSFKQQLNDKSKAQRTFGSKATASTFSSSRRTTNSRPAERLEMGCGRDFFKQQPDEKSRAKQASASAIATTQCESNLFNMRVCILRCHCTHGHVLNGHSAFEACHVGCSPVTCFSLSLEEKALGGVCECSRSFLFCSPCVLPARLFFSLRALLVLAKGRDARRLLPGRSRRL